jgi:hypothetical protein
MEKDEAVKIFIEALLSEIRFECRKQYYPYDIAAYTEYRLKQAAEWLAENSRT